MRVVTKHLPPLLPLLRPAHNSSLIFFEARQEKNVSLDMSKYENMHSNHHPLLFSFFSLLLNFWPSSQKHAFGMCNLRENFSSSL